jgi:glycosyltransferase involved in cell wall biosynthesis
VTLRPRVLIVGRSRYQLPLEGGSRRKFKALAVELDVRVLASARAGSPTCDDTFCLVPPRATLDGPRFWAELPFRVRRELASFRPEAVLAQSPYEAAAVLAVRPEVPVILEIHGDWRTATRLYGSSARGLVAPLADRIALAALRRADAIRTLSPYTTWLVRSVGVEPAATFPAFMDLESFLAPTTSLPDPPRALFVGVLERYKDIDGLASAWRMAAPRLPGVTLHVIGNGSRAHVVELLVRDLAGQTEWTRSLPNDEIPRILDATTLLVLPSRSEGLGRIAIESLCRGRPLVASGVGGITDLVRDAENGILVPASDSAALADALVRVLSDPSLATRLASAARPSVQAWLASPEEFAQRMRALVTHVTR